MPVGTSIVGLIAALSPVALQWFQGWTRRNPTASDDEAKAELERLASSDTETLAEHAGLKDDIAAAKDRLAGEAGEADEH